MEKNITKEGNPKKSNLVNLISFTFVFVDICVQLLQKKVAVVLLGCIAILLLVVVVQEGVSLAFSGEQIFLDRDKTKKQKQP